MSKTVTTTLVENSYNIANNTSSVTAKFVIKTDSGSYRTNKTFTWNIKETKTNTVLASGTATKSVSASSTNTLFSDTFTVQHDNNGEGTVTATFDFYSGWASGNKTITLTKLPRAASLDSTPALTMGNAPAIKYTPKTTTQVFKLAFQCGNVSYTTGFLTPASTSQQTYTGTDSSNSTQYKFPVATWAPAITTSKTGTVTVTLYTYNSTSDTTPIGSSIGTFELTVPSSAAPTASLAISGENSTIGLFLQNKSYFNGTITADAKYGATISKYVTTITATGVDTQTKTTSIWTSDLLKTAGTYTIETTVTDSRGYNSTKISTTRTVYAYATPTGTLTATRTNETATSTVQFKYTFLFSNPNNNNANHPSGVSAPRWSIQYLTTNNNVETWVTVDSSGAAPKTGTGWSQSSQTTTTSEATFSVDSSYSFRLYLEDAFGGVVAATVRIEPSATLINFHKDGEGIGIGKISEYGYNLEIGKPMVSTYGIEMYNPDGVRNNTANSFREYINPARRASANLAATGVAGMNHFLATSDMVSGKPMGDAHIIHMAWDTNAGYDSQLALKNSDTPHLQIRGQNAGTWGNWVTVLDSSNYSSYALPKAGGSLTGNLTIGTSSDNANRYVKVINSSHEGSLLSDTSANLGIWSDKHSKWIVKADSNGVVTVDGYRLVCLEVTCASSSNAVKSTSCSFGVTFISEPMVMVSAKTSVPYSTVRAVGYDSVTTTGCTLYVYRTNTTNTIVSVWAYGKVA